MTKKNNLVGTKIGRPIWNLQPTIVTGLTTYAYCGGDYGVTFNTTELENDDKGDVVCWGIYYFVVYLQIHLNL